MEPNAFLGVTSTHRSAPDKVVTYQREVIIVANNPSPSHKSSGEVFGVEAEIKVYHLRVSSSIAELLDPESHFCVSITMLASAVQGMEEVAPNRHQKGADPLYRGFAAGS